MRVAGADRYRTAIEASRHAFPDGADVVFIASGHDFPDALAGGPAAGRLEAPVLLLRSGGTLSPSAVSAELRRLSPRTIYVLGGPAVLSDNVLRGLHPFASEGVRRLSGSNRDATAAAVAGLWPRASTVYVAAGHSFPDAIAGGAAASREGAPILLSGTRGLSSATVKRLKDLQPTRVVVLGGTSAVPAAVATQIENLLPGVVVSRHAGTDRYDTAMKVTRAVWPSGASRVHYASGQTFPDALAGVPVAAMHDSPLLLVKEHCYPMSTLTSSWTVGTRVLFGGATAVTDSALNVPCGPSGVTVRGVDGGPNYYGRFANGLPTTDHYFPVGVWFESVLEPADTAKDQSVGLNTYVELTANSDVSVVRDAGMYALPSFPSGAANGYLITDEPDMWAGPGSASWTGNYPGQGDICSPSTSTCGFTVMETLLEDAPPGVMTYVNYGKGVTFWHGDAQAERFANYTDLVSADNYWFTDPNICGAYEGGAGPGKGRQMTQAECRLAANYGWTVDRVRSLVSPNGSRPVWNFVEVGHPFSEDWAPTITGPQIRAAVWSGIIHGARGVIYFNHNFGGPCTTQHVLRDPCGDAVRPHVTAVNEQIKELAPVLNAPFVDGLLSVTGAVDVAVKVHNGEFTVFAGANRHDPQQVTFTSKCASATTAQVLGEDRTLHVVNGQFTDHFADGNAVHLYRLNGGTCGLG